MTTDIQTNANIQAVGGDQFVDGTGQSMDLEDLIMAIESKRADLLDQQLADQVGQMKKLNHEIAVANKMLAYARQQQNAASSHKSATKDDDRKVVEGMTFREWAEQNGVSLHDVNDDDRHNKDEWSAIIEGVKGKIDQLNSTSQMEMIRLQALMNKRNQAYELMTNALQKLSGSIDKIIGNIR